MPLFHYIWRNLRRWALVGILFAAVLVVFGKIAADRYPAMSEQARLDERAFWDEVDTLTLEERSGLYNYSLRTGIAPRLLPPWEYDRDMCSAMVTKMINFVTGVKFVHTSAWEFRTHRINAGTVSNGRKLTTVWDQTAQFDDDGNISPDVHARLVADVLAYPFDPQKVYVLGPLWTETKYWTEIKAAGADINSHLVFISNGMVTHLVHRDDVSDPLHFEPPADVFADGTMKPVWLAEVHERSYARKGRGPLVVDPLRLPIVEGELPFTQNVVPYSVLRRIIAFPSKPWFAPESWWPTFAQADSGVEKTVLYGMRNRYDFYPRIPGRKSHAQAAR